jgi:hypothetical protein
VANEQQTDDEQQNLIERTVHPIQHGDVEWIELEPQYSSADQSGPVRKSD